MIINPISSAVHLFFYSAVNESLHLAEGKQQHNSPAQIIQQLQISPETREAGTSANLFRCSQNRQPRLSANE